MTIQINNDLADLIYIKLLETKLDKIKGTIKKFCEVNEYLTHSKSDKSRTKTPTLCVIQEDIGIEGADQSPDRGSKRTITKVESELVVIQKDNKRHKYIYLIGMVNY